MNLQSIVFLLSVASVWSQSALPSTKRISAHVASVTTVATSTNAANTNIATTGTANGPCPDGSNPVQCFVQPCAVAKCGFGQPCIDDYCGGCFARCGCKANCDCPAGEQCQFVPHLNASVCQKINNNCVKSYIGDLEKCATIRFVCKPGSTAFWDERGCGCCDPIYAPCTREYVSNDPAKCAAIRFVCPPGGSFFSDSTGCGCCNTDVNTNNLELNQARSAVLATTAGSSNAAISKVSTLPFLGCKIVATVNVLGFVANTGTPIYQNQCSGLCISTINNPTECRATTQRIKVAAQPYSSVLTTVTQTISCGCKPKRCSVTVNGVTTTVESGATIYDTCRQKCTCYYGGLINCCRQRKEFVSGMTAAEKTQYINAVKTASTTAPYKAQYDALISQHAALFSAGIHGGLTFFPWHRWYILQLENILRQIDCTITVPYWDWGKEAASPFTSSVWSAAYLGGNGSPCVTTGPFASPWTVTPSAGGGCLTRNWGGGAWASSATIAGIIAANPSPANFNTFRNTIENGPGLHGAVHCAINGIMCTINAANAPEFFLHHTFLDKVWADWQAQSAAHVTAWSGTPLFTTAMPGTTYSAADLADLNNQPGGVRVCYVTPRSWVWLDQVLADAVFRGQNLSALPHLKVSETASEWAALHKMSSQELTDIRAAEVAFNSANTVDASQLSQDSVSSVLGADVDGVINAGIPLTTTGCVDPSNDPIFFEQ